ncbi:MAG: undecaprenyldiphospho-muramoylpentapeptide beta-N-acetylglucosaminyltransferase [Eggerthellaceae bacterium]|nr:undecaprenyldiphospho-muramoylpentapeptide beta-N-acetylglucosaminyltransferase [Eggerthellaceae bacterium]
MLSGGGTAGHINPALALAEVLGQRGHEVRFAGTPQGIEGGLVRAAGIEFTPFEASGFNRSHPASIVSALKKAAKSTRDAKAWLDKLRPDAVVCFGGYVSLAVGRAAHALKIPLVIHEQNSVMGLANKYLAKSATKVAVTYECSGDAVRDKGKLVVTGNPVRQAVLEATREQGRSLLGIPDDALVLLVFGGSLGARHINQAVVALKSRLLAEGGLTIVHVAGPKQYDDVVASLALDKDQKKRWLVFGYQDQMGAVMAASDAVVARAGATSLAEISARRLPALLVPFPFATDDHQTTNARTFVECGAAFMVADSELDSEKFSDALFRMVEDAALRAAMSKAQAGFKTGEAVAILADVVIAAAQDPRIRYNA